MGRETVFGSSRRSIESANEDAVTHSSIDPDHLRGVVKSTFIVPGTGGFEYWVEVEVCEVASADMPPTAAERRGTPA